MLNKGMELLEQKQEERADQDDCLGAADVSQVQGSL